MPSIKTRIGGRRTSAHFRVERGGSIPRVHQFDGHSCGFLAALAVVRYFAPAVPARDVLAAILPSPVRGCSQRELVVGLSQFGIQARYEEGLGWDELSGLARAGYPVIVTVQPQEWSCDHWTAIRELSKRMVLLSNAAPRGSEYEGLAKDGSLSWSGFNEIWAPRGAGLVCRSKVAKERAP